jgi:hypothetical protein
MLSQCKHYLSRKLDSFSEHSRATTDNVLVYGVLVIPTGYDEVGELASRANAAKKRSAKKYRIISKHAKEGRTGFHTLNVKGYHESYSRNSLTS